MNKTCADCIHYDACKDMYDGIKADFDDKRFIGCCEFFADKSRYIELPCAVGDTLWVLWSISSSIPKSVYPVDVYALRYDNKKNNMRVCTCGEFEIEKYDGYYTHFYRGTFTWENVSKTVFLTKEEAEKALKGGAE